MVNNLKSKTSLCNIGSEKVNAESNRRRNYEMLLERKSQEREWCTYVCGRVGNASRHLLNIWSGWLASANWENDIKINGMMPVYSRGLLNTIFLFDWDRDRKTLYSPDKLSGQYFLSDLPSGIRKFIFVSYPLKLQIWE